VRPLTPRSGGAVLVDGDDDGFGVEVIKRLAFSKLPPSVETMEVGTGGVHFVLRLLEGFEAVIVVDAVSRGQPPGTLYVFTPSAADLGVHSRERIDPHFAEPARAMQLARALGFLPDKVTVLGCEPESCQLGIRLSVAVDAAMARAVEKIREMVGSDASGTACGH
jgi:hydrogenase maturation protease